MDIKIFYSKNLSDIIDEAVEFFNTAALETFPPQAPFLGSGVYGLYYQGYFEEYVIIKGPIYIGKAVPKGWRTARSSSCTDKNLYNRLKQHYKSINSVINLRSEDFTCRYMLFGHRELGLITTVESQLIKIFNPLWNTVVDGFGNHDPGNGRKNQAKSDWDVLHPGRKWADKLSGVSTPLENIIIKIQRYSQMYR